MVTQFKKGVLELCVLSLISKKDCYGYEIVDLISRGIELSEGTIYPLLRRLTKEEYCTTYLKEKYEASEALRQMGIIDGKDITTESAITKLMILLKKNISPNLFKIKFEESLAGEI